ncbi:MAG: aminoglycoside phosphotransferase family protein [Firmicutes bacterium]|nr:aminoglycoside phosphotransferase family protein [Bacillota bacterium]
MLKYTDAQIKEKVENILNKEVKVTPIGNHQLDRHLVYLVTDRFNHSVVFKLYYKKNRRNREIASLNLLTKSDVRCPKIVANGKLKDGTEWLITEYIKGQVFDKVRKDMDILDQLHILKEMGNELGKIHSYKTFDFFGNWDRHGKSIENIKDYRKVFIRRCERTLDNLLKQQLPDINLQRKAAKKLRDNYHLIDNISVSRLSHNDFDGRNVLVKKTDEKWKLSGVLDFEQCIPWDKDQDIATLYHKYFLKSKEYKEAFYRGYNKYFNDKDINKEKINFYLLYNGLVICSWTYDVVNEYYKEGIKLLKHLV